MPNAIGTDQIGISFVDELNSAGLGHVAVGWSSDGKFTFGPSVTSEEQAQINEVFNNHNPETANLKAYAGFSRYNVEHGGFTSSEGWKVATDKNSQTSMTGATTAAAADKTMTTDWKFADGTFMTLNGDQIRSMQSQAQTFIAQCFSVESSVNAGIDSGSITTKAQIDAAFDALKSRNSIGRSKPTAGF
jgi:hypothetical protein